MGRRALELKDKIAVITGAGSGIGRALALKFADDGARFVVCSDLNGDDALATAAMIGDSSRASGVVLDVGDEAAVNALVAATEQAHGGIDVFVSNAGYGVAGGLDLATEQWTRMMNVHTWSHLYAARAVIPGMIERGGGYLLNTASAAGLLTQMDSGPYAVSKHAAVAFAEWLQINYAEENIGVSVLCPQAVRTNILGEAAKKRSNQPGGSAGQAGADGILEPEFVAQACVNAMRDETFLVLPHEEVLTYFQRKANDYDRWLGGMQRFRRKLLGKG